MIRVFIGLGSNLDRPREQLQAACEALGKLPSTRLVACSPLYASAAVGPGEQPDYVNAVAELATTLAADALLDALQAIEHQQGRERGDVRWTARTLDLDLLLYGDRCLDTARLQVPHPRMHERNFVLQPLADLTPDLILPDGTALSDRLASCPPNRLQRL